MRRSLIDAFCQICSFISKGFLLLFWGVIGIVLEVAHTPGLCVLLASSLQRTPVGSSPVIPSGFLPTWYRHLRVETASLLPPPCGRPVWTPPVRLAVGGVGWRGPRSSGASAWAGAGSGLVGRRGRCSASSVFGLSARRVTGLVLNAGSPSFRARPPGRGASSSFQDIAFDSLTFRL